MPSLLRTSDREEILSRLRHLEPARAALWGHFTAPAMVCHLADQLRVATGELPATRHDTLLRRTLLKWIVIYAPLRPPPGKIQTAPEMLSSSPTTWAADLAAVEVLIQRLATTPSAAVHPFFGPLSHEEWARLAWKHLDHHLRQFGC